MVLGQVAARSPALQCPSRAAVSAPLQLEMWGGTAAGLELHAVVTI